MLVSHFPAVDFFGPTYSCYSLVRQSVPTPSIAYSLILCWFNLLVWRRVAVLLSQITDVVVQHSIIATDWTMLPYAAIFEANSIDLSRICSRQRKRQRERLLTSVMGMNFRIPWNICPDVVWWDDQQKSLTLAELKISYETNYEVAAAERKEENMRSWSLESAMQDMGLNLSLWILVSGGVINPAAWPCRLPWQPWTVQLQGCLNWCLSLANEPSKVLTASGGLETVLLSNHTYIIYCSEPIICVTIMWLSSIMAHILDYVTLFACNFLCIQCLVMMTTMTRDKEREIISVYAYTVTFQYILMRLTQTYSCSVSTSNEFSVQFRPSLQRPLLPYGPPHVSSIPLVPVWSESTKHVYKSFYSYISVMYSFS